LRRTALFCGYADPLRLATKRLSRLRRIIRFIDDSVAGRAQKRAVHVHATLSSPVETGVSSVPKLNP
jgi:hypothetical protein